MEKNPVSQRSGFMSVQLLFKPKENIKDVHNTAFFPAAAGFDPAENRVYSDASRSESEEWQLLVDQTDTSHRRAVIIKSKRSEIFLAVRNCQFTGLTSYTEDCKWLLD